MIRSVPAGTTYQVTDLTRNVREVVDRARQGGALIRDKDGTTLLLERAADVAHDRYMAELAAQLLRLRTTMDLPLNEHAAAGYGAFAWLLVFEENDRREFLAELTEPLLIALSGGPLQPVINLIADWQVTAEVYSDESLRAELTSRLDRPLRDVQI